MAGKMFDRFASWASSLDPPWPGIILAVIVAYIIGGVVFFAIAVRGF